MRRITKWQAFWKKVAVLCMMIAGGDYEVTIYGKGKPR